MCFSSPLPFATEGLGSSLHIGEIVLSPNYSHETCLSVAPGQNRVLSISVKTQLSPPHWQRCGRASPDIVSMEELSSLLTCHVTQAGEILRPSPPCPPMAEVGGRADSEVIRAAGELSLPAPHLLQHSAEWPLFCSWAIRQSCS